MITEKVTESKRVFRHTSPEVNNKISRNIEMSVAYFAEHSDQIDARIDEMNDEWTIEQTLQTNASILALSGLFAGIFGRKIWLLLPLVVLGFLLQHAIQGWCPPVVLFRRLGFRTSEEINRERNALCALRGDFDPVAQVREEKGNNRAEKILNLMHG
ncbi:MAG TPA: hypothetical protein VHO70_18455 [Chitinispirillaceae bacterium]|nr:hypothetical protein [Chitinispirillaceae bacterium]